jgi:aminopeptidase N
MCKQRQWWFVILFLFYLVLLYPHRQQQKKRPVNVVAAVPVHYDVSLQVDVALAKFNGNVKIHYSLLSLRSRIGFHSVELELKEIQVTCGSFAPSFLLLNSGDYYYFDIHSSSFSSCELYIRFSGNLSTTTLRGFYLSKVSSSSSVLATTQFEPTDARRAFPCLDDPSFKATFNISITAPSEFHALSNMPQIKNHLTNQATTTEFQQTKPMSTYLVAFIISDFQSISSKTAQGVHVAVYTRPGFSSLGKYALETAVKCLEFYDKIFNISYPLPKLDLIAIPDFAAGAMENWGLVTFRETALLYDDTSNRFSSWNKQQVAQVIAHELAHQWFGNLVTMKWWSDLWLNEGFAEFMEYKAINAIQPSWMMQEQFVYSELFRSLKADQSAFTHSIAVPVSDPTEIEEIFDDISYGKGASVLR